MVASTYARKWFSDLEKVIADRNGRDLGQQWAYYRLKADRCGDMTEPEWMQLSNFGRSCWYWSYWNRVIEQNLCQIDQSRWMLLRLDKLRCELPDILRLLDLDVVDLRVVKTNESQLYSPGSIWDYYELPIPYGLWDDSKKLEFTRWCGGVMDKHFPGWRDQTRFETRLQE